jgi:Ca2+-binding RTX toxin-like protein
VTFTDNNSTGGSFVYTGSTASPSASDTGIVMVDRSQTGATLNGTDFGEIFIGRNTGSTINANGGNDVLIGGTGNDTLNGGAGDDLIIGGGGADTMNGNAGNDTFVFRALTDSPPGGGNFDTINGFIHNADHIDLTAIAGATNVQGQVGAANTVAANSISWFDNGSNQTIVYVNTTATTNHVDMEIHLTGTNINLTGADILHHS